ncbi:hypothetical protein [Pseudomonas sp. NPDC086251]|jgi:hypothetical protein|uniref:hypothetical protein n=1 Tax=Pseudomonas sp. NPDC086251 TaxID=3364431 RepID=UPI003838E4D4
MAFTPIRVREAMLGRRGMGELAFGGVWQAVFSDSTSANSRILRWGFAALPLWNIDLNPTKFKCGSGLAREGGVSGNTNVD